MPELSFAVMGVTGSCLNSNLGELTNEQNANQFNNSLIRLIQFRQSRFCLLFWR
jgi:hypothetical protein